MSRIEVLVATAVVGTTLLCGRARAGDVRFDPNVLLRVEQDGNVKNVGGDNESDEFARLQLNLVLSVRNPSSTWMFAFRPYREVYNEFSDLDNTGLGASIEYGRTWSEETSLDGAFSYSRSYRQEFNALDPDAAVTFTPRSTIDNATLRLDGSVQSGPRSSFDWGVAGRMRSQDDSQVSESQTTNYDDSNAGEATLGWSYGNSPRSSIGGAYIFQGIRFDRAESTIANGVVFTQELEVGRAGAFEYRIGAFRATTAGTSITKPSADVRYRWTTGPQSSFSIGARQGVSGGDGRGGATLDTGGYLTWVYNRPRRLGLSATLTYWDRAKLEGTQGAESPPSALTVSEYVSLPVGDFVRLGLNHTYRRQSNSGEFDTSYHSFGLFMRWAVFGERRTG